MKIKIDERIIWDGPAWKLTAFWIVASLITGMISRIIELVLK
jgi:hypothetical protein